MNPSVSLAAPAPAPTSGVRARAWSPLGFVLLLALLAALRPLSVPDEGRYADIGRWMLLSGDWLTPRLDGLPFFTSRRSPIGCRRPAWRCSASRPGPRAYRACCWPV
ncbi:hypothetical protein ACFSTJ_08055 [Ottowia pentelensis]|uniref:hypothetical protein n=1 Tax=Ottowia pentelensis TaxID=511108 RepID=UPI0036394E01